MTTLRFLIESGLLEMLITAIVAGATPFIVYYTTMAFRSIAQKLRINLDEVRERQLQEYVRQAIQATEEWAKNQAKANQGEAPQGAVKLNMATQIVKNVLPMVPVDRIVTAIHARLPEVRFAEVNPLDPSRAAQ